MKSGNPVANGRGFRRHGDGRHRVDHCQMAAMTRVFEVLS
jgi:hypothetical protein